jgi:CRP/FNR family transcriptional regulator, cyclic AMP receptor protein
VTFVTRSFFLNLSALRRKILTETVLIIIIWMSFVSSFTMFATTKHFLLLLTLTAMFRHEYASLAIFNGLDSGQVDALSPVLEEVRFSAGQVIFQQGQPAEFLFILLRGQVQVRYKPYDGPALTVARILPGDVFGWSAALGRDIYTSGAQAAEDCSAYRIRTDNLHHLCDCDPEAGSILLERLAGVIAERLRNTHSTILDLLSQGMDRNGNCVKRNTP